MTRRFLGFLFDSNRRNRWKSGMTQLRRFDVVNVDVEYGLGRKRLNGGMLRHNRSRTRLTKEMPLGFFATSKGLRNPGLSLS